MAAFRHSPPVGGSRCTSRASDRCHDARLRLVGVSDRHTASAPTARPAPAGGRAVPAGRSAALQAGQRDRRSAHRAHRRRLRLVGVSDRHTASAPAARPAPTDRRTVPPGRGGAGRLGDRRGAHRARDRRLRSGRMVGVSDRHTASAPAARPAPTDRRTVPPGRGGAGRLGDRRGAHRARDRRLRSGRMVGVSDRHTASAPAARPAPTDRRTVPPGPPGGAGRRGDRRGAHRARDQLGCRSYHSSSDTRRRWATHGALPEQTTGVATSSHLRTRMAARSSGPPGRCWTAAGIEAHDAGRRGAAGGGYGRGGPGRAGWVIGAAHTAHAVGGGGRGGWSASATGRPRARRSHARFRQAGEQYRQGDPRPCRRPGGIGAAHTSHATAGGGWSASAGGTPRARRRRDGLRQAGEQYRRGRPPGRSGWIIGAAHTSHATAGGGWSASAGGTPRARRRRARFRQAGEQYRRGRPPGRSGWIIGAAHTSHAVGRGRRGY